MESVFLDLMPYAFTEKRIQRDKRNPNAQNAYRPSTHAEVMKNTSGFIVRRHHNMNVTPAASFMLHLPDLKRIKKNIEGKKNHSQTHNQR